MARRNSTSRKNTFWSQPWAKMATTFLSGATIVASYLVFYYSNRELDLNNRFNDKLEFQKIDCERDNEERNLKLKLEVQAEYYEQVDEESATAKKLEKVFDRIDKNTQK